MAEIVAAALTSHAPLITGKPEVSKPEQRDRLYAGFHELRRRLAAARPDLLVMLVNDHLQNFAYNNLPAFCVGLAASYDAPSEGGARLLPLPSPGAMWSRSAGSPTTRSSGRGETAGRRSGTGSPSWARRPAGRARCSPTSRSPSGSPAARRCGCIHEHDVVSAQQDPDRDRAPAPDEGHPERRGDGGPRPERRGAGRAPGRRPGPPASSPCSPAPTWRGTAWARRGRRSVWRARTARPCSRRRTRDSSRGAPGTWAIRWPS